MKMILVVLVLVRAIISMIEKNKNVTGNKSKSGNKIFTLLNAKNYAERRKTGAPCEMQQGRLFLQSSLIKNIAVFQLEEFVIWNHEVVSSSLACYTTLLNGSLV